MGGSMQLERAIMAVAAQQLGVITLEQLRRAGASASAIQRRAAAGFLQRLHRGVYLVSSPVIPKGARELAAVLACGEGGVASHRSAARLWELQPFEDWSGPPEVKVVGRHPGAKPGIRVHRVSRLHGRDVRRVLGVPVTAPAATILDLATLLEADELESVLAEALGRGLVDRRDLDELLGRSRGRRGVSRLRPLIVLADGAGLTRSEAERELRRVLELAGLPQPRANPRISRHEVDFLWREQRLILEVDGYTFHSGRRAFEQDRARQADLVAAGYSVVRVTWLQLTTKPMTVVARIASALAVRSGEQRVQRSRRME
jgi:very-short-patch-repair endonuclease